jgi:hypothetical protein
LIIDYQASVPDTAHPDKDRHIASGALLIDIAISKKSCAVQAICSEFLYKHGEILSRLKGFRVKEVCET